jgi:hypothetical protein
MVGSPGKCPAYFRISGVPHRTICAYKMRCVVIVMPKMHARSIHPQMVATSHLRCWIQYCGCRGGLPIEGGQLEFAHTSVRGHRHEIHTARVKKFPWRLLLAPLGEILLMPLVASQDVHVLSPVKGSTAVIGLRSVFSATNLWHEHIESLEVGLLPCCSKAQMCPSSTLPELFSTPWRTVVCIPGSLQALGLSGHLRCQPKVAHKNLFVLGGSHEK